MNQSVENLVPPTLGSEVEEGVDFKMWVEIGRNGNEGSFLFSDTFSPVFVLKRPIYRAK